jgi:hypothetical protein
MFLKTHTFTYDLKTLIFFLCFQTPIFFFFFFFFNNALANNILFAILFKITFFTCEIAGQTGSIVSNYGPSKYFLNCYCYSELINVDYFFQIFFFKKQLHIIKDILWL